MIASPQCTARAPVQFVKRPDRGRDIDTIVANRRVWRSRCGRYRIVESRIRHLSTRYYAQVLDGECWSNVSEHRKRKPAQEACRRHARRKPTTVPSPGVATPGLGTAPQQRRMAQ